MEGYIHKAETIARSDIIFERSHRQSQFESNIKKKELTFFFYFTAYIYIYIYIYIYKLLFFIMIQ